MSQPSRVSPPMARAGAMAAILIVAAAVGAGASRYPLAHAAPVNAASAQAPVAALYAILLAAGILFLTGLVAVMWPGGRRKGDDEAPFVSEAPQVHWLGKLLAVLLPLALAAALVAAVVTGAHAVRVTPRSGGGAGLAAPSLSGPPATPARAGKGFVLPGWLPWSVFGILLVAILAVGLVLMARRRRRTSDHEEERGAARRAVEAALNALGGETEPRAAVIAAYAAMQDTLASEGVAHRQTEAPREYLHRVLMAGTATRREAGTLTGLFEEARFSTHPISARMQDAASETLALLRARLSAEEGS